LSRVSNTFPDGYNPNCPYCGKFEPHGSGMMLPDRNLKNSAWHVLCFSRFIWDNRDKCDLDTILDSRDKCDLDTILDRGRDTLDKDFATLIMKVNAAEMQYNYKKIVLTV
jgi:hypothetical protein